MLREEDGNSRISENENYKRFVILIFLFFVFQPGIYISKWDLPKTALDLVNLGPQSSVCNLHPYIWSRHCQLDNQCRDPMNNRIDCRVGQSTTYDPRNCSHPNNPHAWAEYAIVHFEPFLFLGTSKNFGSLFDHLQLFMVHWISAFGYRIQDIVEYKEHIVQWSEWDSGPIKGSYMWCIFLFKWYVQKFKCQTFLYRPEMSTVVR